MFPISERNCEYWTIGPYSKRIASENSDQVSKKVQHVFMIRAGRKLYWG